jgi:uncharacterized Tic20 family protein
MTRSRSAPDRTSKSDRLVGAAVATHLVALVTGVFGSAAIYFLADSAFVTEHARNALNWQLWFLAGLVCVIASTLVAEFAGPALLSDLLLFVLLLYSAVGLLASVVVHLVAAGKAGTGVMWRYPVISELV